MPAILHHLAAHHLPIAISGTGALRTVTWGPKTRHIFGDDLGLNGTVAMRIAQNKSAASYMLERQGIATLAHRSVTRAPAGNPWEIADRQGVADFFRACGADVVCKPAIGSRGARVERARGPAALSRALEAILQRHRAAAVSAFTPFELEYRCIMLDAAPEVVFRKRRERLAGDGVRTRGALIEAWGATSADARRRADLALAAVDRATLDLVPRAGERFLMDWRHKLANGAAAEWLEPDAPVRPALEAMAAAACRALGIRFCSVDIADTADGLKVVEVNSTVLFEKAAQMLPGGEAAAVRLYERALRVLFEEVG